MIVSIEEGEEAMVTCLDETRHGLEDGDFVTFTEVKGMDINSAEPRKITTKGELVLCLSCMRADAAGPYTFTIGDTRGLGTYKSGGLFTQVKMPKILQFVSQLAQRHLCSQLTIRNPSKTPSPSPNTS